MKWVTMAKQPHTSLRSPGAMPSFGWSGIKLAAIGLWSSGNTFSGVMNHASPSGSSMDESGFGGCQEKATCPNAVPAVMFGGLGIMVWGYFSWFRLGPLVPVLPTLGKTLSCFSMTMPPCTKQGPCRNVCRDRCEELDWPAQSPDLNPVKHLWDKLERRLRARTYGPTSVPDLSNACG